MAAQKLVRDNRRRGASIQGAVRSAINRHIRPAELAAKPSGLLRLAIEEGVNADYVGARYVGALRRRPAPRPAEVLPESAEDQIGRASCREREKISVLAV